MSSEFRVQSSERTIVIRLTGLSSEQLLELEAQEIEAFGDGALNRWHLPVIARYGYLFALFVPSPSGGEGQGEGEIVGLASFVSRDKTAFLVGLWVRKDSRNKGLGKRLLSESINQLKSDGIKKVELTVDEKNLIANRLYTRLGFKQIKKIDAFYGPNQSRLLLSINLVK